MKNNKIKVAHVIRVFSYGGAEVLLREIFASPTFQQQVISDLFVLDHKKLGLLPQVEGNIRNAYYYRITTIKFLFEYIKFLRHIAKGKYDIVHMHLPVAGWMGIVAKLFTGRQTKFIYSEHNLVTHYSKYNYNLSGLTYSYFDAVIYVSHEVGEVIKEQQKGNFFKTQKAVTILNGIDTDKFNNSNKLTQQNDTLTVGLVARFRPQKRVDRWAEVAAEVKKLSDKFSFLMVGDGPSDGLLRERMAELGLKENTDIQLPGQQTDTFAMYKKIDIFLLTSDFEGLPLALLEAMSCGCVPVVSDVGGIRQLEFDGFGDKFQNFNAKEIARQIVAYLDKQKWSIESKKSREFVVQNFSLHKQVDEILLLYKEMLGLNKNLRVKAENLVEQ